MNGFISDQRLISAVPRPCNSKIFIGLDCDLEDYDVIDYNWEVTMPFELKYITLSVNVLPSKEKVSKYYEFTK